MQYPSSFFCNFHSPINFSYGEQQLKDLEETINKTECDSVVIGTPIDLSRIIKIDKPYTRVHYELDEVSSPNLHEILEDFVKKHELK